MTRCDLNTGGGGGLESSESFFTLMSGAWTGVT